MIKKELQTKDKILEAAKDIFLSKGYNGARMQGIADQAGINKAALHYHFQSKENLFNLVFRNIFSYIFHGVNILIDDERPFKDKIEHFVEIYISFLRQNPRVFPFIINEVNMNQKNFGQFFKNSTGLLQKEKLIRKLKEEMDEGKLKKIPPEHLIINVVSLCIFPFLAKNILMGVLETDEAGIERFYEQRKQEVTQFIIDAVVIK